MRITSRMVMAGAVVMAVLGVYTTGSQVDARRDARGGRARAQWRSVMWTQ